MKLVFTLLFVAIALFGYGQNGQKWSLNGNSGSTTNFLGTTNAAPLIFKTNNTERITIGSDGVIYLNSFATYPAGLLYADAGGKLMHTPFTGNNTDVLAGDGHFYDVASVFTLWKTNGNYMFPNGNYSIGIGTDTPQAILDVNGDAIIRGTLHVYDGIIIGKTYTGEKATLDTVEATKMQAEEMKAEQYKTNTITIDGNQSQITSTTGLISFGSNTIRAGNLISENMQVNGNILFDSLRITNHLQIGNSSLHLASTDMFTGTDNRIYATGGDLLIQSESGDNHNTILNGDNKGFVGIGTLNPEQNLHIKGVTNNNGQSASLSAIIRIEDEYISNTIPSGDRTAYWDIVASSGSRKMVFRTDQGTGSAYPVDVMSMTESGQMIIGPTASCAMPTNIKLLVDGHILLTDGPSGEPRSLYWGYNCHPEWGIEYNKVDGGLNFWNPYTSASGLANYRLFLEDITGFVGIGTNNPQYELDVCGTIRAQEVKVNLNGSCPDFVFEPNYQLMTFDELRDYLKNNKHLPGIPSASETAENGINLSEMNMMLLQKVEELTLYILELEKRIGELENN